MLVYAMIALALYKFEPDGCCFKPYSRYKSETSMTNTSIDVYVHTDTPRPFSSTWRTAAVLAHGGRCVTQPDHGRPWEHSGLGHKSAMVCAAIDLVRAHTHPASDLKHVAHGGRPGARQPLSYHGMEMYVHGNTQI